MTFTKVAPAGIGTSPGNSILIGDSLLHSTGIDIGNNTGVGVTIRQHGDATFTGIVTAAAFYGDGSGLEGVSSSGIGTPLSDDDTSDLNKIYYTNQELVIDSTVTVNHPDTGIAAYTHYQDLVVKDSADFIVADGDTFIPDVLGINTSSLPNPVSSATGGRIRAGTITNAGANGAPNFPNGVTGTAATFTTGTFSGAISAASGTITGNLGVGGVLTYEDVTNVDSVGLITARAGINLVGNDLNVGSNIKLGNASGIATVSALEIADGTTTINKHSVGIGTTTTAGRNAGVSTAIGTFNYNTTLGKLEYYNGIKWLQITDNSFKVSGGTESTFGLYTLFTFTSNGTFTVTGSDSIDILVVGGGGQGGLPNSSSNYGGGGGAGGLVWYTGFNVAEGEYSIVVGNGGTQNSSGSGSRRGNDGSDSTAFGLTAKGGGGGGGQGGTTAGRDGGSGGGGAYPSGYGSATQSSQSNSLSSGTLVHNLGNNGGPGNNDPNGGGGGGGAGGAGYSGGTGNGVNGGLGHNMSSLLGTAVGDNGWFSGGGGGSQQSGGSYVDSWGNGGQNNYGGGGRGCRYNTSTSTAGDANTGGGGGAGSSAIGGRGGGSGVVIIRVLSSLL